MAEGVQKKIDKEKEVLIFLIKLLVLSIPLYLILWFNVDLSFLQEVITKLLYSFLIFSGVEVKRNGFALVLDRFFVYVSKDCTGWKGMLFLSALILSTKSSLKQKLLGFVIHIPSFFSFNMLRILLLLFLGSQSRELFYMLHNFLWQISMVGVVLILWAMWIKFSKNFNS